MSSAPAKPKRSQPAAAPVDPQLLAHPLDYAATGHRWKCPATGLVIEKRTLENIIQRERLLTACETDQDLRQTCVDASRRSFLVWVNLFVWTYRQHAVMEDGTQRPVSLAKVPFITWPVQDDAGSRIIAAIHGGKDILLDKSRDMGATWLCVAVIAWLWVFHPHSAMKVLSRKEEEVDSGEDVPNPDTLMWKVRFIIDHLPPWMQPSRGTRYMHLANRVNGSVIDGESTNKHAGRGGRRKVILLDECSAYDNLESIEASTHQAATCRIFNATPVGPTYYSELRFSGRVEVIVLGFWDHPEKGRGRYLTTERGKQRWTSPWRERQKQMHSPKVIAQNIDIDHQMAGSLFFDADVLVFQTATYASEAMLCGDLMPRISGEDLDQAIRRGKASRWPFKPDSRGKLQLWVPLYKDKNGLRRPRQDRVYCMGCDISHGSGGSNSVAWVADAETGEQVAELATANEEPATFARTCAMLGWWFGGDKGMAFIAWENNGLGTTFTRTMVKLSYPWLYQDVIRGQETEEDAAHLGWTSTGGLRGSRIEVLGSLRDALGRGELKVRSKPTLVEAGKYVIWKRGFVGPARLEEESADALLTHGDRIIAAAVCREGMEKCPLITPRKVKAPLLSIAHLDEEYEREESGKDRPEEKW